MKADKTRNGGKRPVNLTLSADSIRKGEALKKTLFRPSLSNVIEYLIEEAAAKKSKAA